MEEDTFMQKITVDPVTRIEGHLKIEVEVDNGKIVDARSSGEMFRGFENILAGRNPVDAVQITQRICGVCPAAHAQASALNLDSALKITPPDNGRLIRNLMLGANFIQSHILHFYHLAALDYVDVKAILQYRGGDPEMNRVKAWVKSEVDSGRATAVAPLLPRYEGDYIPDAEINIQAVAHYLQALHMRRKAHEMLAVFGGKMPHEIAIVPGGVTERPTIDKILEYSAKIEELQQFIDHVYVPDVLTVAEAYPRYFAIGKGCGNLLAYGGFEEVNDGSEKFFTSGTYIDGKVEGFSPDRINEYVTYSKYSSGSGLHPSEGETTADPFKADGYSWLKAPRYKRKVVEVGPLARMGVAHLTGTIPGASAIISKTLKRFNADVSALFSVLGRHAARAIECKLVADRCAEWVTMLDPAKSVHTAYKIPKSSKGFGLTEGPRGALGHWITIENKKIGNYQAVVPTTWNAGPRDDRDNPGPIEQALIDTPVRDGNNPIEPLRVVRSFDPCIACAVHVITPDGETLSRFRAV
jgi:Ni,Fe-hydrogenase I large subunit